MRKFIISENVTAYAPVAFNNESIKNVWRGFTFTTSELTLLQADEENTFTVGDIQAPTLPEYAEYVYTVSDSKIAIRGKDCSSLVRGLFDLLMKVEYDSEGTLYIEARDVTSEFAFKNRMIHFCAFNQTRLFELKKLIRLAASVGYTHGVVEFWGMFPYECCPELAWDEAYSKEEIRALTKEMRELGIEPIPMLNHLGHATACRLNGGKHVALDRSPKLYKYFTPDGWSWDISSPLVRELLRKIRAELYEIFGEGEYFHLGLDESYMYAMSPKLRDSLPEYLSYITNEVVKEGRRPMIWMDMFLPAASGTPHLCNCGSNENMYKSLEALNKRTVLIDWEYNSDISPATTTKYMADKKIGFDIMHAPWTKKGNYTASVNTVKQLGIFGFMMTTWHTMAMETPAVLGAARLFGAPTAPWSSFGGIEGICGREETATLLRKLSFEGVGNYRDAGWCDEEILLNIGDKYSS